MDREVREELGDLISKITKLINAIGAEVSARSRRSLKEQNLCFSDVSNMNGTKPVILLSVLGPLQQLQQHSAARIQTGLQERAKARRWIDSNHVDSMGLGEFPRRFLCQSLRYRIPFLTTAIGNKPS